MKTSLLEDSSKRSPKKRSLTRRLLSVIAFTTIGMYLLSMTAQRPNNLGLRNGRLAACPASPNCVSTQTESQPHSMQAVAYHGDLPQQISRIKQVIAANSPRARLVEETECYLAYEFTSLIFRFVDDVEFFVDDKEKLIHFRSASRVGHSDLGANRTRMSKIVKELSQ